MKCPSDQDSAPPITIPQHRPQKPAEPVPESFIKTSSPGILQSTKDGKLKTNLPGFGFTLPAYPKDPCSTSA